MHLEPSEADDENGYGKEDNGNTEEEGHYSVEKVELIFSRKALVASIIIVHLYKQNQNNEVV